MQQKAEEKHQLLVHQLLLVHFLVLLQDKNHQPDSFLANPSPPRWSSVPQQGEPLLSTPTVLSESETG